jgi:hypothetical protein
VVGDLAGGGFGEGGFTPFALFFGEAAGQRPSAVNATGRIGIIDSEGTVPAPPTGLGFFVNGDVTINPDISDGSLILHANGTTTIDVTGNFFQRNTITGELFPTTLLFNGVGGAGALLGPVTLVNATALRLYGTIDGLEESAAVRGVTLDPDFDPDENHRVNDCRLDTVTCLSPEDNRTAEEFPVGLADSNTLRDAVLTPDVEALFGFFEAVGFIHPTLEEEEPVTNRANDEEWLQ